MDNYQPRSILSMRFLSYVKISIFILALFLISLPSFVMADSTLALSANVNSDSIISEPFCTPILSTFNETELENTNIDTEKKHPRNMFVFDDLQKQWNKISSELNKTQIGTGLVLILNLLLLFLFLYLFLYHPCKRLYDYLCVYNLIFEALEGRFMLFICLYFVGLIIIFGVIGNIIGEDNIKYIILSYIVFCIGLAIYDAISYIRIKILIYQMKKSNSEEE